MTLPQDPQQLKTMGWSTIILSNIVVLVSFVSLILRHEKPLWIIAFVTLVAGIEFLIMRDVRRMLWRANGYPERIKRRQGWQ